MNFIEIEGVQYALELFKTLGINGAPVGSTLQIVKREDGVLTVTSAPALMVGEFNLYRRGERVVIYRNDGEGGEFSIEKFHKVVEQFYNEEF